MVSKLSRWRERLSFLFIQITSFNLLEFLIIFSRNFRKDYSEFS